MRDKFIFSGTIVWVLASAVALTILLAIPLYGLEILLFHLQNQAGMSLSAGSLWHNFLVLMNYLLNPFVVRLDMPNFPSSASGLEHFSQVKHLFLATFAVVLVLLPAFVIFIKENLRFVFHNGLRILMMLPLFCGVAVFLIGFENFFIYFHEAIFRDKSWVFCPRLDPIINVLPENYFLHLFLVFVLVYEFLFFLIYFLGNSRMKKSNF